MNTDKYTLEELEDLLKDNPKLPQEARTVIEKAIAIKKNKTQEVDFSKKIMIGKGSEHYVISVGMSGVDKGYKVGDKVILQDDITAKDMSEGVKGDSKFIVVRTGKEVGIPLSWVSRDKPKAKTTPKKRTTKKATAKPKVSAEQKAERQKKLADATGKSLDECKEILAKYEALRGKTTEKDKKRIDKLDKDGKLIEGTQTKTAESTTETTTKVIPKKIKQEVDAIEKEAQAEAIEQVKKESKKFYIAFFNKRKIEIEADSLLDAKKKAIEQLSVPKSKMGLLSVNLASNQDVKIEEVKKKEVDKITKEKIEEKVEEMTSDLADAGKKFLKSIQSEIAKYSKDDAKKFLLDIKTQVELLLRAYGHGGQLEGITQEYAIAWAGGGKPSTYAKGGKIEEFVESKGYTYPKEVYFEADGEFLEVIQADNGKGNVGIFYYTEEIESISKNMLDKIASEFGDNYDITLFTNAGVDLHSSNKGKYKNITIERIPRTYAKGGKTTHAINQDRRRLSQEPWEQAYLPKRKGSYYEEGGEILNPSPEIVEYLKNHTKEEAYRYNNSNWWSRFISDKQYQVNRNYISQFAKGGRTRIVNEGVDFTEKMYRGIMGDKDNDGIENADDVAPDNANINKQIEQVKFTDTFKKLLDNKKKYDDSMYSVVGEMEKMFPDNFDIIARTKTPFSILKKLVEKRLEGSKGLTDVIGTTVTVNNNKELQEVSRMIGNGVGAKGIFGEVLDFDDFFASPNCGYMAYHYIVDYKGTPVEIQVKTKRMKKLNEFSHQFYKSGNLDCKGMGELSEIVRKADDGDKQAQKEFADIYADKELMESMISY